MIKTAFILFLLFSSCIIAQGQTNYPCDTSLWQHVYHSNRLKVLEQCKTVTGAVMAVKPEKDGDYHIRVKLDSGQENLINEKNIQVQHGCLVVEIICGCEVSQKDAVEPCQGYVNNVRVPVRSEHVQVTGSFVYDAEHGWMEIHPVTKIVLIE